MTQNDEKVFGTGVFVYCNQHLRPHTTGWCSVDVRNKTPLTSKTVEDAYRECRKRGLVIYGEPQVWHPALKEKVHGNE